MAPDKTHKHAFRRAFKKVIVNNSPRHLLLWVCTGKACGYKEAYDLTAVSPQRGVESGAKRTA